MFFATTNDDRYLLSQTGNRRFWPVKCGQVRYDALARDRDQLWAEAAAIEARGVPIGLPEAFWPDATVLQGERRVSHPWESELATIEKDYKQYCCQVAAKNKNSEATLYIPYATTDLTGTEYRISTSSVLKNVLNIPVERQTQNAWRIVAQLMNQLGWSGPVSIRDGDRVERGYRKKV